ncbi:hypothetical protein MIR68_003171 [Amoeboaphelidium protococcarum]|nr:hypothetical protein MIR68_003171 [Amoeboaphelidium protococcarum]
MLILGNLFLLLLAFLLVALQVNAGHGTSSLRTDSGDNHALNNHKTDRRELLQEKFRYPPQYQDEDFIVYPEYCKIGGVSRLKCRLSAPPLKRTREDALDRLLVLFDLDQTLGEVVTEEIYGQLMQDRGQKYIQAVRLKIGPVVYHVALRPHIFRWLSVLSESYTLGIWTAGLTAYGKQFAKAINYHCESYGMKPPFQNMDLIFGRKYVYYGTKHKDLRLFPQINVARTILIDNSFASFGANLVDIYSDQSQSVNDQPQDQPPKQGPLVSVPSNGYKIVDYHYQALYDIQWQENLLAENVRVVEFLNKLSQFADIRMPIIRQNLQDDGYLGALQIQGQQTR